MEIYKLKREGLFIFWPSNFSFFIRLKELGDIWLFNCFEGCQHVLIKNKFKISQIKKIIITDNNIKNISGLLGLLSSISLNTNTKRIDIYGPKDLFKYIFWSRKYSQTSFRYSLYLHKNLDGLIMNHLYFNIYRFYCGHKFDIINYAIILPEKSGPFNAINAAKYKIPFGPLYGYFKIGKNFILPDGFIIYNKKFVLGYYLGSKLIFTHRYVKEASICMWNNSNFLLYY